MSFCRCPVFPCKHTTAEAWAEHVETELRRERDEARATARVLAHAYETDNRPPSDVVARALAYPVKP